MGIGTDRGLPRAYVVVITALFALNPMIVFYGSNGMSEAPFIFFLTWAVRRLIMWMVDDDVHHLIAAGGIAMGLAYLTRYDAVACVAAAGIARRDHDVSARPDTAAAPARAAGRDVGQWPGVRGVRRVGGDQLAHHRTRRSRSSALSTATRRSSSSRVRRSRELRRRVCLRGGRASSLLAPTLVPIALWAGVIRAGAGRTGRC